MATLDETQIDQSNVVSATQTTNQLASDVVDLAGTQLGTTTDSDDTFPLADLLSHEPFAGPFKYLKKDKAPKISAADSTLATLKGIKALTEICAEDFLCQNEIADFGVLCLLRRLLLEDDYEQLAAIEAYDASKALEAQDPVSSAPGESAGVDTIGPSNLRVPAIAHIRRHVARLLTVLSVLPKVQKVIVADEYLCKWLEKCAKGHIYLTNNRTTLSNTQYLGFSFNLIEQRTVQLPDQRGPGKKLIKNFDTREQ
ncbi:unnamed protein product [Fraxinus pennsylvanica]|uniref:Uncharacterized protein n=1 Tax=Fraxinus pennsylvanica TaxID=56036 RepID=A0AAD1ZTA0_9LAMI|nr:unnamed protein product [Fraxinus pennsylvanica]